VVGALLRVWLIGMVAAVVVVLTACAAHAQTVRDDFAGPQFSTANWFPCGRDENLLSIVPVPEQGFNAARLQVNPRRDLMLAAHVLGFSGCRREDRTDYALGLFDERAELWEAEERLLRFGTDVWYRFSMFIDPALPLDRGHRLVVGQWKQQGGHSPFLAQRIINREFVITVEQDNEDPSSDRDDDECRIVVAFTAGFPASLRGEFGEAMQAIPRRSDGTRAASIAHDRAEGVNGMWSRVGPCARDIEVTRHAALPNPVGNWVTMTYRLRAGVDERGLLEVWADGQAIATVRGRFGFRDGRAGLQYFKYGPYRDHAEYSTTALLAGYARGATRADVDPPP
jgi:hypothetical protein